MLNCCIERKKARESSSEEKGDVPETPPSMKQTVKSPQQGALVSSGGDWEGDVKSPHQGALVSSSSEGGWEGDLSSEDEFFECADEDQQQPMETSDTTEGATQATSESVIDTRSDCSDNTVRSQSTSPGVKTLKCESTSSIQSSLDTDVSFTESWTHMPEGRRQPYLHHTLLHHPQQTLYIPLTQEPSPMTEDMLEQHADVLSR